MNEIQELLPPEFWIHVPGKETPADILSQGLELALNLMWMNGPAWLKTAIEPEPTPEEVPSLCLTKVKITSQVTAHNQLTTQLTNFRELLDIE